MPNVCPPFGVDKDQTLFQGLTFTNSLFSSFNSYYSMIKVFHLRVLNKYIHTLATTKLASFIPRLALHWQHRLGYLWVVSTKLISLTQININSGWVTLPRVHCEVSGINEFLKNVETDSATLLKIFFVDIL